MLRKAIKKISELDKKYEILFKIMGDIFVMVTKIRSFNRTNKKGGIISYIHTVTFIFNRVRDILLMVKRVHDVSLELSGKRDDFIYDEFKLFVNDYLNKLTLKQPTKGGINRRHLRIFLELCKNKDFERKMIKNSKVIENYMDSPEVRDITSKDIKELYKDKIEIVNHRYRKYIIDIPGYDSTLVVNYGKNGVISDITTYTSEAEDGLYNYDVLEIVNEIQLSFFNLNEKYIIVNKDIEFLDKPTFKGYTDSSNKVCETLTNNIKTVFNKNIGVYNFCLISKPGTGKTSIVYNILSRFNDEKTACIILSPTPNIEKLNRLISGISSKIDNVLLIIDDFDVDTLSAKNKDSSYIYKILDGSTFKEQNSDINVVNVLTLNSFGGIHPALLRSGRMDKVIELPEPRNSQDHIELLEFFHGEGKHNEEILNLCIENSLTQADHANIHKNMQFDENCDIFENMKRSIKDLSSKKSLIEEYKQ